MVILLLLVALSTAGVFSAPQQLYYPTVTFMDSQDSGNPLHHHQEVNIPDSNPPIPVIGKSLEDTASTGLVPGGPMFPVKSHNNKIFAELIGKYITEELQKGHLKNEDISDENGNSKYADVVSIFFKDLLQIPLVFLHAFSDAIARLTASKPAVLVTPVSVPFSATAAAAIGSQAAAPAATRASSVDMSVTTLDAGHSMASDGILAAPAAPGSLIDASAAPSSINAAPAAPSGYNIVPASSSNTNTVPAAPSSSNAVPVFSSSITAAAPAPISPNADPTSNLKAASASSSNNAAASPPVKN